MGMISEQDGRWTYITTIQDGSRGITRSMNLDTGEVIVTREYREIEPETDDQGNKWSRFEPKREGE